MKAETTRRELARKAVLAGVAAGSLARAAESAVAATGSRPAGPKVRWEEMLPDELLAAIEKCPICYCAYGLAEPHGPYSALGVDWIKARGILERAAAEHGGVVAPPFAWHVQDRPFFPWLERQGVKQSLCSAIPGDLWLRMSLYQIRAIDARGFHAGILITGHYGGLEGDLRLLCEYYTRRTGSPLRLFAGADPELIRVPGYGGDHAGVTETSQMLAIRPDLMDLSREAKDWPTGRWAGCDFPSPDGRSPSAEVGEQIVASQVARLGEIQRELLESRKPKPGWQAPSFNDTEALWQRFETLTRKYWWCSLTLDELEAGAGPKFPGWETLGE